MLENLDENSKPKCFRVFCSANYIYSSFFFFRSKSQRVLGYSYIDNILKFERIWIVRTFLRAFFVVSTEPVQKEEKSAEENTFVFQLDTDILLRIQISV